MNVIEVSRVLLEHNIKLGMWKGDFAKCIVEQRTIMIPTEWLDSDKLNEIALALLHEIGHITHTTFDHTQLTRTDDEFFVLNCIEDTRVDLKLIDEHKIRPLYKKVFMEAFGSRGFKRVSFMKRVCWTTMLEMLGFESMVTSSRPVSKFIADHKMCPVFQRGIDLLQKLEDSPSKEAYGRARAFIIGLTLFIKGRGK